MTDTNYKNLKQHAQDNTYQVHGNPDDVDCVIGFAFGARELGTGISNQQIAEYIEQKFPDTPLIVQGEVADALQQRTADHIIRESRNKGEYLHSREIAEQAQICMRKNNWDTAAIVTHPAMEARNVAVCEKIGIKTIAPNGLEVITFDPLSTQPWTRNKSQWWNREKGVIDTCIANSWI